MNNTLPNCMDCEKPYKDFTMDMLFPRGQWLLINPDEQGLLCAQCMVARASKVPGAVVIHAVIEFVPKQPRKG